MTLLTPPQARAYVNHGRWVADCPYMCGGALILEPRQATFPCKVCNTFSPVEWPENPDEIFEALEKRHIPKTRNWYPSGHYLALKGNMPHGQTVEELLDEQLDFEEASKWLGQLPSQP